MGPFIQVLLALIPVYLTVATGSFLRKFGLLKKQADSSLMHLAVHVFMPCLILEKMLTDSAIGKPIFVFSAICAGFTIIALTTFIAYYTAFLCGLKKGSGKRTFGVATGIQNYGYLAIPLVDSLFPNDGAMAVLFVHNIGVELALWTVCLMLLSGNFNFSLRVFLKGPILAVAVGLLLGFTGISTHVPNALIETFRMLGACALPIALLLIGSTLYDLWGKEKIDWRVCGFACSLRAIFFPILILTITFLLPLPLPLKQVLLIQSAMPAAMFPIILARQFQGQAGIAVQVVLSTTIFGMFSIPIILYLGMKLLNL